MFFLQRPQIAHMRAPVTAYGRQGVFQKRQKICNGHL